MFYTYETDDPFNYERNRNFDNTSRDSYNCAGYALETYSCYCPYGDYDRMTKQGGSFNPIERNLMSYESVRTILNDFPDTRLISTVKELHEDEYAFAFRVGDDDFHFVKRGANGHWYEKRGCTNPIYPMTKQQVFAEPWGRRKNYTGPIFLFAKKRTEI